MSKDVKCPYCGADVEINHDDGYGYEEDVIFSQECSECEKEFVYTISIEINHKAKRADCLNGSPHKYEKTATTPPKYARMRCVDCGDEVTPS
jgi:DNA-directed RNA polymerase subunit RPC12/RpoP